MSFPYEGLGFAGIGTSLAGYGSIAQGDEPDLRILIDSTGQRLGARYIDPITRDYVLNANGHIAGMNGIQQEVYLAILTVLGSSVDPGLGQTFSSIRILTDNTINLITNSVNVALNDLIKSNKISLTGINVIRDENANRIRINIFWVDLLNNSGQQTDI